MGAYIRRDYLPHPARSGQRHSEKGLIAYLTSGRMMRKSHHASPKGQPRGPIKDVASIRERPPEAEAEDRAGPGDWEGDLLAGSRFVVLVGVIGKDTESVVAALSSQIR